MTRAWVVLCALCLGACTTERMIGSTCIDGVCDTAAASTRVPCLITTAQASLSNTPLAGNEVCVVDRVHKSDDDMAPCRLLLSIDDPQRSCTDLGLEEALNAPDGDLRFCAFPQLVQGTRGMVGGTATGWYLEGSPLPAADPCAPVASHHLRFNGELPSGTLPRLECVDAFADPATVSAVLRTGEDVLQIDPEGCAVLPPLPEPTPRDVGSVCSTRFEPPDGFFTNRTYVDARSEQCETGVCLVDATRAAQSWPCTPGDDACEDAGAPELGNLTYCSCRCDAKGDQTRVACQCPSNFSCRDVLSNEAPDALAGGYCVRESAF